MIVFPVVFCRRLRLGVKRNTSSAIKSTASFGLPLNEALIPAHKELAMPLFTKSEKDFVTTLGGIIDCNPFLPERMTLEKRALGSAFLVRDANWNLDPTIYRRSANVIRIAEKAEGLLNAKKAWNPRRPVNGPSTSGSSTPT